MISIPDDLRSGRQNPFKTPISFFNRLKNPANPIVENNFELPETYRLLVDVWLDLGTDESWTHVFSGTDYFELRFSVSTNFP